ncbi:MAG: YgjP-like metallopeptidase domain-containing protein [Acidilobaceae archaeon]
MVFRRSRGRALRIVVGTYVEVRVPRRLSLREARKATRRLLPYLIREVRKRRAVHRKALRLPTESRSAGELRSQFSELLSGALAGLQIGDVRVTVSERLRFAWAYADVRRREVRVSMLCRVLPQELLWYLAVHEACHFLSPRHDGAFWQCVKRICPGYREAEELLKLYSIRVRRGGEGLWTPSRS